MDNDVQRGLAKHEHHQALPDHTLPAAPAFISNTGGSYYNNTHYGAPDASIFDSTATIDQTMPFPADPNIFDAPHDHDDFSIFHHDHFLEHNSLTSSSTPDPSFLTVDHHAAPLSTPFTMPSAASGAGAVHGGLYVGHDVGVRILEQLQTLNTTMSGMYEMMRQQQQQQRG